MPGQSFMTAIDTPTWEMDGPLALAPVDSNSMIISHDIPLSIMAVLTLTDLLPLCLLVSPPSEQLCNQLCPAVKHSP